MQPAQGYTPPAAVVAPAKPVTTAPAPPPPPVVSRRRLLRRRQRRRAPRRSRSDRPNPGKGGVQARVPLHGGRRDHRNHQRQQRSEALADRAEGVFRHVEKSCTRFDPTSALMLANAAGDDWCEVPEFCYRVLSEAAVADRMTAGRFDPRVLRDLQTLGYDRSLPFGSGPVELGPARGGSTRTTLRFRAPWSPSFDPARGAVRYRSASGRPRGDRQGSRSSLGCRSDPGPGGGFSRRSGRRPRDRWPRAGAATGGMRGVEDPRGGATPLAVPRRHRSRLCDVVDPAAFMARRRPDGAPHHRSADRRTLEARACFRSR